MYDPLDCLNLPAGSRLFSEDAPGDCAYLIKRGEIEVFVQHGDETVVLARRGAGEIIGEMALIDHGTRSASARAHTDCELIVLTSQQIQHRIEQTDPILRMCLGVVIERYRDTLALYADGVKPKPPSRAAKRVLGQDFHEAIEVLTLERELERAIHNEEFELYFQPIVALKSYELAGFEALIRWNHPQRGIVSPGDFIPTAEQSGLIVGITNWCLHEVARTFPLMQAQATLHASLSGQTSVSRATIFMSVNVSGHDLIDPVFDETVKAILFEAGIAPESIKLEITESVLMKDPERAGRILQACRHQGMGIAVDDFGTGYSSLSYLSTLPITTLKIDRAFVRSIAEEGPSRKIVSTIRHLARELDIPVVAEGIETEAQAAALIAMNCDFGQGYLFGRPVPLAKTLDLIMNWSARPAAPADVTYLAEKLCA